MFERTAGGHMQLMLDVDRETGRIAVGNPWGERSRRC
jgi:hypothetical protein